ncbi:hypothetical protein HXX76_006297 [Chlamydomonas incerta]|uniref:Uncharacterized protein n=1 Tax=Chlamydomonas incerta TaxID=51695 RepID=A0A835T5Z7_CHLIN|nr:hypothetical protein HXX76_006297 [Chlamydomonas incerta]|eukprot:KAG2436773.1 hypothetical protein HXX76_006297 [Chlamydomonas incerta]
MDGQSQVVAAHAAALRARQLREAFQQAKAAATGLHSGSAAPTPGARLLQPDVSAATAFWQRQLSGASSASAATQQPRTSSYADGTAPYGLDPTPGLYVRQAPASSAWAPAAPAAAGPQAGPAATHDAASSRSGRSGSSSASAVPQPRRPAPIVFFAGGPGGAPDAAREQQLLLPAMGDAAVFPGDRSYGAPAAAASSWGQGFAGPGSAHSGSGLGSRPSGSGSGTSSAAGSGVAAAVAEGAAAIRLQVEAMRQQWQAAQQRQRGERRAQQWPADEQQQPAGQFGGGAVAADGWCPAPGFGEAQQQQGRTRRAWDAASSSSGSSTGGGGGGGSSIATGDAARPGLLAAGGKENRGPGRGAPWDGGAGGHPASSSSAAEPGRRRRHSTGPEDPTALYSFGGPRGPGQGVDAASAMLRALVTATGRRPLDPVITASGRRPAPPPPRKQLYAPDPAADAKLPVFVNAAALPPGYRPPAQQHRRRRWGVSGGPAAAGAAAPGVGTGAAAGAAAGQAAPQEAPAASQAPLAAEGEPGSAAADDARPSGVPPAATDAHGRRGSSVSATSGAAAAGGAAASTSGPAPPPPPADPWSGRPHVYLLHRDVDVYMPDVNPTRPRPASAVMGRSRRGVAEGPAAAAAAAAAGAGGGVGPAVDARPTLQVDDTLLRRRVPAASFAAAPYKPPARSPSPSPQRRRRRRAWELPGAARGRSDASDTDGRDGAGGGASASSPPHSPGSPTGGSDAAGAAGGYDDDDEDAPRRSGRSRSRSRSAVRAAAAAGEPGTGDAAARGGGRSGGRAEAHGARKADALRQTTAEALRAGPAVGFGRAPRFGPGPGRDDDDDLAAKQRRARSASRRRRTTAGGGEEGAEGVSASASRSRSRGRHRSRSRSSRRRRTAGDVGAAASGQSASRGTGGATTAREGDDGEQAPTSPSAASSGGSSEEAEEPLAPLRRLDAAYAAVLPRVTGASFAASSSRRFDWLGAPAAAAAAAAGGAAAAGVGAGKDAATQRRQRRRRRRWVVGRAGAGAGGGGGAASAGEQAQAVPHDAAAAPITARGAQSEGAAGVESGDATAAARTAEGSGGAPMSGGDGDEGEVGEGVWEPMAPLAGLAAAVDAVRPRVRGTTFAHRSVAEQMRTELRARRERQLEKARQLQQLLQRQPVDELWPAVAAQLRRERLAALGERRRRRWSDQDHQPAQQQGSQSPQEAAGSGDGMAGASSGSSAAGHRSYSYSPSSRASPAPADATASSPGAGAVSDAGGSPGAASPPLLLPSGSAGRGQERASPGAATAAAAGVDVGATPSRPPLPRARGLFLTAMKSPSPHSSPPRAGAAAAPPAAGTTAAAATAASADTPTRAGGARRSSASAALLPERPPHFLAATRAMLASMEAPLAATTGGGGYAAGAGGAAAAGGAGADGGGATAALPPVPPVPSYVLVEKRAPVVGFSPARASTASLQPSPRYSREPGPGHYEPSLADGAVSRHARAATPVFGSTRRPVVPFLPGVDSGPESPTRAAASAAADVAWLDRDAAAALDYTRRRAPAVVIAPPPAERAQDEDGGGGGAGKEGLGPEGARLVLDVRYTLVERRVQGMPRMRPPPEPSATVSDEDGVPLERWAGPDNPWDLDLPTRRRRPAWGFPAVGHLPLAVAPAGRELLDLRPVYDLVTRRLLGGPDFARTPDRYAGEEERLRRARRQPTALDYEAGAAWAYLCRHVPGVIMRLAAERWPPPQPEDDADGASQGHGGGDDGDFGLEAEVQGRQRRQAFLELGAAIDAIRPRPPAWTFAPLVTLVRRDDSPTARGRGFGPLLSFDINIGLTKRRLAGALPWAAGPERQGLLDPRLLAAARHLAPGTYEVELAWRAVQAAPHVPAFQRFTGHGLIAEEDEEFVEADGGELPYGARLVLQVGEAKDAVLRRRDAAPGPQRMSLALGRAEDVAGADPAYTHRTAHLPLPDPGLDEPTRPRTRNVVIEAGAGHLPPAPEPTPHEALRGPGAYHPEGAEQALAAVGPAARVVDFSKAPERRLLEEEKPDAEEVLEGNRLVLSPHTALDYVRPRPHAALIPPLVPHADREPDPAFHAVYDVDPGLDLVLRRPPGHPGFDGAAGRDPALPVPYGIEPRPAAYGGHVGHGLAAEDVPLAALAGFRRAPGAPDFGTMVPRDVPKPADYDGQRLDLEPAAALDALRRRPPGPADMALQRGRWEAGPHPDWDLTAWLDYNPSLDAVRQRLVAQLAVPLGRQIGREQAARADPRVGEAATGDLDAGCYRVRHRLVMRSAPAIDFARGADPRHTGLQPGGVPADPDAGNVLLLQPRQPAGWQPPAHKGAPWRQPFGRGEARWERPFADPAYRFLAAAGDEGGALLLRHSADDLAALRARATAANAPAAAWGWMTSRRDAQVLQPDPAVPPPPRAQPRAQPRGVTLLVRELPPRNTELELIKNNPPNDARVVAIRRRDRVLARMVAKIKAQRAAVANV